MPDEAQADGQGPLAARPGSPWEIFVAFTVLALQGFGGVIAVAQRELCDRRGWLSPTEFVHLLGHAQILPGPNVCNLATMIGDRFFGWRGAFAALAGMILAPLVLMLGLAWTLTLAVQTPAAKGAMQGALLGVAAVAAGQVVGTVLKLAEPLRQHVLGLRVASSLALVAFGMTALMRWPLVWVLLGWGGLACAACHRQLQRTPARASGGSAPQGKD